MHLPGSNPVIKTPEEDKNESIDWYRRKTNGDDMRTRCSLDLIHVCVPEL